MPRRRSSKLNIRNSLSKNRELRKISTRPNPWKQLIHHRQYTPKLGICKNKQTNTEHRSLIKLVQPLVQTKGNNEQKETEKREPVSKNQVSESGETGPLTTQ
ncbi:Hypothetical_protein [Hexamita inflata]|nr:Hypothetical protein HINF_LOCUS44187 [Hexamita inflata]